MKKKTERKNPDKLAGIQREKAQSLNVHDQI
jgi:hypothetical protein